MVSGLAPGSAALTEMVGKSTCGSGDTGSSRKATTPASATAMVSSVVATGLRMNGSRDIHGCSAELQADCPDARACGLREKRRRQPVEEQINHRSGVERQHLADRSARR